MLADVYPAGEAPIHGADGRALARAIRLIGTTDLVFVDTPMEMDEAILKLAKPDDIVVTMGAGSVGQVPVRLQKEYKLSHC